jgi:hypothetical protein
MRILGITTCKTTFGLNRFLEGPKVVLAFRHSPPQPVVRRSGHTGRALTTFSNAALLLAL